MLLGDPLLGSPSWVGMVCYAPSKAFPKFDRGVRSSDSDVVP